MLYSLCVPRLPRFWRARSLDVKVRTNRIGLFAGELIPGETLSNNLPDGEVKPLPILHIFPVVVAEHLFIVAVARKITC